MTNIERICTVLLSEVLLAATTWHSLADFGWLSLKTFILAIIAGAGSLLVKEFLTYLKTKL